MHGSHRVTIGCDSTNAKHTKSFDRAKKLPLRKTRVNGLKYKLSCHVEPCGDRGKRKATVLIEYDIFGQVFGSRLTQNKTVRNNQGTIGNRQPIDESSHNHLHRFAPELPRKAARSLLEFLVSQV